MSLKRLTRQFRREFSANPKKAVVLGLLAVVALYFWAPLVWGWMTKGSSTDVAAVAGQAAGSPGAASVESHAQPNATPGKGETPQIAWQQLVKFMQSDPRTLPANLVAQRNNPFTVPKPEKPQPKAEPEPKIVSPTATPQSLGLTLSGTVIGPQRRAARINGKTFQQGQTLELVKDGKQITFMLAEVQPRRVILTREGAQFELTIPDPTRSQRIELTGKDGRR